MSFVAMLEGSSITIVIITPPLLRTAWCHWKNISQRQRHVYKFKWRFHPAFEDTCPVCPYNRNNFTFRFQKSCAIMYISYVRYGSCFTCLHVVVNLLYIFLYCWFIEMLVIECGKFYKYNYVVHFCLCNSVFACGGILFVFECVVAYLQCHVMFTNSLHLTPLQRKVVRQAATTTSNKWEKRDVDVTRRLQCL